MKTFYFLIILTNIILISACNRPVASFTLGDGINYHAPANINFLNKSQKV